jgi:hypothetical protein
VRGDAFVVRGQAALGEVGGEQQLPALERQEAVLLQVLGDDVGQRRARGGGGRGGAH